MIEKGDSRLAAGQQPGRLKEGDSLSAGKEQSVQKDARKTAKLIFHGRKSRECD